MCRFAVALSLLLLAFMCSAQPSLAVLQDAGAFHADIPGDWEFTQEGGLTSFTAPDDSVQISIFLDWYDNPDVGDIVAEWAGDNPATMVTARSYRYEEVSGGRSWGMLAEDGTFVEITVSAAYPGIGVFLKSLAPTGEHEALRQIFAAAVSEASVWLAFTEPDAAGPPQGPAANGPSGK